MEITDLVGQYRYPLDVLQMDINGRAKLSTICSFMILAATKHKVCRAFYRHIPCCYIRTETLCRNSDFIGSASNQLIGQLIYRNISRDGLSLDRLNFNQSTYVAGIKQILFIFIRQPNIEECTI